MPDMGAIRYFVPGLEKHFTVVHWSQRGAGKSHALGDSSQRLSMRQFEADLAEVIQYLHRRFGHQKLFLVGQSWGTALSTATGSQRRESL